MTKLIAAVLASLVLGFGAAYFMLNNSTSPPALRPDNAGDLEARLAALERQLAEERAARRELQASLDGWLNQDAAFEFAGESDTVDEALDAGSDEEVSSGEAPASRREQMRERMQARFGPNTRQSRLEQAGFAPDQAERILEREKALRLDSLYDQWERRRQNYLENPDNSSATDSLRAELGEQAYERYLEAFGRPTTVRVSDLMEQSPAAYAGFQAGDEIVRYNGERVFDVRDLNAATVKGDMGEPVIVDVIRGGVPMQLTIERGPLGIESRPGRRGRR